MTVKHFFETANSKYNLDLFVVVGNEKLNTRVITTEVTNRPGLALGGFFKFFAYDRIQVIGTGEKAYIEEAFEKNDKIAISNIEKFLSFEIPCCVVSKYSGLPKGFLELAENRGIPILGSGLDTYQLSFSVELILNHELAKRTVVNGELFDIYNYGVLIIGRSGIGKSEIALELIERRHRFVADDVVLIKRIRYPSGYRLVGEPFREDYCHLLEVRGIGIVNVEELFGLGVSVGSKEIDLVIELIDWDDSVMFDRIGDRIEFFEVLDVKIPKITIPVAPGRNLSYLVELAVMNYRVKTIRNQRNKI